MKNRIKKNQIQNQIQNQKQFINNSAIVGFKSRGKQRKIESKTANNT